MIITVVCSQRENITFDQSLFLLPVWPCRKTKDTWYWNVFQKNETDCSTVTLMSCSGLDHPLLQQLPHHQTDPKCIDEEHKNCTMKTDFYSLWSKWYWPEFHHKIPLILLFSKYMKLFEIWFILWSLKFCFKISINWFMAFFLNVDEKRFDRDCLWPQCRHLIKLEWVYITSWGLFIQPIMLDLERGIDPTPSSPSFWVSLTPLVQISSSFYSSPSKITDGSYNFHQENTQWLLANQQSDLGSYRVKTAFGFTLILKLSYLWKRNGLKTV